MPFNHGKVFLKRKMNRGSGQIIKQLQDLGGVALMIMRAIKQKGGYQNRFIKSKRVNIAADPLYLLTH
jgi:hypothetical protein